MCMEKPVGEKREERRAKCWVDICWGGDSCYSDMQIMVLCVIFYFYFFFWRLTDKCFPLCFQIFDCPSFIQSRTFTCPHTKAHKPELIQYRFLHLPVYAECALLTMWANGVAWWKWGRILCQLDWQGTWDVSVWGGEKTGLRLLYITDSRVQINDCCCCQCEGGWSAPLWLIPSQLWRDRENV